MKQLLDNMCWEELSVDGRVADRGLLRFMPNLLDMSSEREPDTDQVGRRQDDAAKVHQWLDVLLEKDIVCWIGLVVVAALARRLDRERDRVGARCTANLKLV